MTIFGTNFTGFSTVQFGDLTAASTAFIDNRTIQAVVPENAASGRITVETPAGAAIPRPRSSRFCERTRGEHDSIARSGFCRQQFGLHDCHFQCRTFTAPNVFLTNALDPTVTLVSDSLPQAVLAGAVCWTDLPSASAGTFRWASCPKRRARLRTASP